MDLDSIRTELNSTPGSLTRVCSSCSEKLLPQLRKLEPSELKSTLEEAGKALWTESNDTPPQCCDICLKNTTRVLMPTAVYYMLLTQRGTHLHGLI